MHAAWVTIVAALYVGFYSVAFGQTYLEMNELHGYLFNTTRYNRFLRPLRNQSDKIQVIFTKYLERVEHFDIATREVLITGYFEISWRDEFLTWDPNRYGGKEIIQLPTGTFWKPEFNLMNGRANEESSVYGKTSFPAWVTSNGHVTVTPGGTFRTRCNVDTTLYPLDIHDCDFDYIVFNHGAEELVINIPLGYIDDDNLEENGEWEFENNNAAVDIVKDERIKTVAVPMVTTSFTLKRRPTFIIINIYSPLLLMTCLNIATCYVRPDSGERLSFIVTLYLSLVLSSLALAEKIPNNSLRMPYMSYHVLLINLLNTIGVTWSIFIVYLASVEIIDQKKIPTLILKMVLKRRQRNTCIINKIDSDDKTELEIESLKERGIIPGNERDEDGSSNTSKIKLVEKVSGREVADVADTMFFWFLALSIFVLNCTFLAIIVGIWAQS